jgi:hypothetical protein
MATRGFEHAAVAPAPRVEIRSPRFVNQAAPRDVELDSVPNWIGNETSCAGTRRHETARPHRHQGAGRSGNAAYWCETDNTVSSTDSPDVHFQRALLLTKRLEADSIGVVSVHTDGRVIIHQQPTGEQSPDRSAKLNEMLAAEYE